MSEITKDTVKVIVQESLRANVVFRSSCIIRHEVLDKDMKLLTKRIDRVSAQLWAIITLLFGNLLGLGFFLAR